jgi:hypothetical protein
VGTLKHCSVVDEVKTNTTIKDGDTNFSATVAKVIMKPCDAKALRRFTATIFKNGLSTKARILLARQLHSDLLARKL